jgi:tetratricopeptide (TPR) repeat protein
VFTQWRGYAGLEKYGRRGQEQFGLDLVGTRPTGGRVAVQCKNYESVTARLRTIVSGDIRAARTVKPPIVHMDIAVAAKSDRQLIDDVEVLRQENMSDGSFSIELHFRDTLYPEAEKLPDVIQAFAPTAYQAIRRVTNETAQSEYGREVVDTLIAGGIRLQSGDAGLRAVPLARKIIEATSVRADILASASSDLQKLIADIEGAFNDARIEAALLLTEQALTASNTAPKEVRAAIAKLRGRALSIADRKAEAIPHYEDYLRLMPDAEDYLARQAYVCELRGDSAGAQKYATKALAIPGAADLGLAILLSKAADATSIDALVADNLCTLERGFASMLSASQAYIQIGRFAEALKYARRAKDFKPADIRGHVQYAICRMLEASPAEALSAILPLASDLRDAAQEVSTLLLTLWPKILASREELLICGAAQHYAYALTVLGKPDDGLKALDDAIAACPSQRLEVSRIHLLLNMRDVAAASAALSRIDGNDLKSERSLLSMMIAQMSGDALETLRLIDVILADADITEARRDGFLHQKAILLCETDQPAATRIAEQMAEPSRSLRAKIFAAHIFSIAGEDDKAESTIRPILDLIDEGTKVDGDESYIAGKFAEKLSLLPTAIDCVNWAARTANDNPALRLLIRSLSRLGRWQRVREIIEGLPQSVQDMPYFKDALARLHEANGDVDQALTCLKAEPDPEQPAVVLLIARLQLLLRRDRAAEARAIARALLSAFVSKTKTLGKDAGRRLGHLAASLPTLLHIGKDLGLEDLVSEASVAGLSVFPGHPIIELTYTMLLLSREPKTLDKMAAGAYCDVRTSTGETLHVLINPDALDFTEFLRPFGDSVAIDATDAGQSGVLGCGVGSNINFEIDGRHVGGEVVAVAEMHFLLHGLIFSTFESRYPGQQFLQKFNVARDSDGAFDFSPVFQMLDRLERMANVVLDLYEKNPIPIALLAHFSGTTTFELWESIVSTPGRRFFSWHGSLADLRSQADSLPSDLAVVVDPLTLIAWWRAGKLKVLTRGIRRVLLAPSTKNVIAHLVAKIKGMTGSVGSMFKRGGRYIRQETSSEDIERFIADFDALSKWIDDHAEIVPATIDTKEDDFLGLIYQADSATADTIRVAKQEGAMLWTDDLRLANLARQQKWCKCVCWHVLLQQLTFSERATPAECANILAIAAGAQYTFVHVNDQSLHVCADEDSIAPGWKIRALLQAFSGDVEITSGLRAFSSFLRGFKRNGGSEYLIRSYTFIGISALTRHGRRDVDLVLGSLALMPWLRPYLAEWAHGHFIQWP